MIDDLEKPFYENIKEHTVCWILCVRLCSHLNINISYIKGISLMSSFLRKLLFYFKALILLK